MKLKKPLNFKQQIERLRKHGINVEDEKTAINVLKKVNYYRFTGYALQFREKPNVSEYLAGTSFEKIYKIFLFDKEIRDVLRKYIEIIEVFYKTQISYGFSMIKCTKCPYNQHYDRNNFFNKEGFDEIKESFSQEKNYYRESLVVKHHNKKYGGEMPLWVLVELMSFSNVSKLYSAMYNSDKEIIAKGVGVSYKTLENNLHCLSVLRNKCAHAARLYNTRFNPPAKINPSFLKKNPDVMNDSLFAYILILMKRLPDKKTKEELLKEIKKTVDKNSDYIDLGLIGFPDNYYLLLKHSIK